MRNRFSLSVASISLIGAFASFSPAYAAYDQTSLPDAVKVPAGNSVALETAAAGEITYQCRAKKDVPDQFEWVFVGPSALLKDRKDAAIGAYYGPPATWNSTDGSTVTGAQVAVAPAGEGNIPSQLVKANLAVGAGVMQGVTYIQRVATQGGTAPKATCAKANEGEKQVVQYKADYIFYKAQ